jgi:hypothetical protein
LITEEDYMNIQNEFISVQLDPNWPRLVSMTRMDNGAMLSGCTVEAAFHIDLNGARYSAQQLTCSSAVQEAQADYHLTVLELGLDLHFRFRLEENEVNFSLEEVSEGGDFRLETLYLPDHCLVTGTARNGDAYLRHAARRSNWGRDWTPGTAVFNQWEDWGLIGDAMPEPGPQSANHACIWNEGACAVVTTSIYVSPLMCRVSAENSITSGRAGRFSIWSGPYSYRLRGELADPLLVRIALLGDYNGDGKINWADAAGWEGDQWYQKNPLYEDTLVYKIGLDTVKAAKPHHTCKETLEIIRQIAQISEGRKQIVYLVGWQDRGHDSGFPCHSIFNQRVGGLEGLLELIEAAKAYNCTVSLHANFDDSYEENPEHRPDLLSRGPDGKPYVWFFSGITGTRVYSINHTLAMESGYHQDRLERLLEKLPLVETIHFDAHRVYNETWISADEYISAECEVQRGMVPLARLLKEHGLDLTVEGSDSETRGMYSFTWLTPNWLHPYVTVMRHGRQHSIWRDGMPRDTLQPRLEGRALGQGFVRAHNQQDTFETMVQHYYQDWMYTQILYHKKMLDFRAGDWDYGLEAQYEDDTWVRVDGDGLSANYEGIPIARGDDRFLPWSDDTIYGYSLAGGEQEWLLPESWAHAGIHAVELVIGEEHPVRRLSVEGRKITFAARPNIPIRLIRLHS